MTESKIYNPDSSLTPKGMEIAYKYAKSWLANVRDTTLEHSYPELIDAFWDIRNDPTIARRHAMLYS